MRTRSSPSRGSLVKLGVEAGLSHRQLQLPKSELFRLLKTQYDVKRLERRAKRNSLDERITPSRETAHKHEKGTRERRRSNRLHKRGIESISSTQAVAASDDAREGHEHIPRKRCRKGKDKVEPCQMNAQVFTDDMDPITRAPLGKHVFTFKRPYGKNGKFDAETLADYILATGDFTEPETRIPFSPSDMKRLDDIVRNAGIKKGSVYEAINNQKRFKEQKVTRDSVIGLERCIGELISEMLSIIDAVCDGTADPESAETRLLLNVFPVFAHYFTLLRGMDRDYASTCIKQYVTFLAGPPNRPTRNELGLRDSVLQFLLTF